MRISILILAVAVMISCGQGGQSSQEEGASGIMPYGAFARGTDTLWVEAYDDPIQKHVQFQFYAANDKVGTNLADYADLLEATEAEERYVFKDSSDVTYADLVFIFSYETGDWRVEDNAFKDGIDTDMDLSGAWVRVKEE